MSAARTPGPWIAETCTPDGSAWTIRRAHGFAEFKRHNWDKATALEVAALYNANEKSNTERDDERARVRDFAQKCHTLIAQRDALAEALRQLVFEIEELVVDGTLRKADVNEHVSIITARAALAIVDGAK